MIAKHFVWFSLSFFIVGFWRKLYWYITFLLFPYSNEYMFWNNVCPAFCTLSLVSIQDPVEHPQCLCFKVVAAKGRWAMTSSRQSVSVLVIVVYILFKHYSCRSLCLFLGCYIIIWHKLWMNEKHRKAFCPCHTQAG